MRSWRGLRLGDQGHVGCDLRPTGSGEPKESVRHGGDVSDGSSWEEEGDKNISSDLQWQVCDREEVNGSRRWKPQTLALGRGLRHGRPPVVWTG